MAGNGELFDAMIRKLITSNRHGQKEAKKDQDEKFFPLACSSTK